MFMLIATLCLQTSATDAECRREVQGVYADRDVCRDRMEGQQGALLTLAGDIGARVLFLSVRCERGKDA